MKFDIDVRATIRPAYEEDINKILSLYSEMNDPSILPRSREDYESAISTGGLFILEGPHGLLAASGIFATAGERLFLEFGGTAVHPSIQGLGVQTYLLGLRVGHVYVHHYSAFPDGIFTAVDFGSSPNSHKNVMKAGFFPIEPDPSFLIACASCKKRPQASDPRICCCSFFGITHVGATDNVTNYLKTPETRISKDGKRRIEINSCALTSPIERTLLEDLIGAANL